jgi:putative membrane protein
MRRHKKFFSSSARKAIEAAVKEAEAKTSGEIVPVVARRCAQHDWIGYRAALIGWLAATLVALWMHYRRPFVLGYGEELALQALGLLAGWALSRFRWGLRLFVPEHVLANEVEQAAQLAFLRHGLANTRHRTGVLVYVSLRERRVHILADKGIHAKVGEAFWKEEVDRVVGSIRAGEPAAGIAGAVRSIGEKLHAHFPRQESDVNELPDSLRTE